MSTLKVADPASFELDGIEWRPSTDEQDMIGVDYKTRHAYQATVNDLVYVLNSRVLNSQSNGHGTQRLEWWCGARHLRFAVPLGAHETALDAARHVAAAFAENPRYFLDEDGPSEGD